jgi:hypothetical protein
LLQNTFFLFQKPFCKQKPLWKNAAQKEPVLRKKIEMSILLVNIFTEGKKA